VESSYHSASFQIPITDFPAAMESPGKIAFAGKKTPDFLLHVSPQVTLLAETDREYFASIAGT
jgi:hypothetical protein